MRAPPLGERYRRTSGKARWKRGTAARTVRLGLDEASSSCSSNVKYPSIQFSSPMRLAGRPPYDEMSTCVSEQYENGLPPAWRMGWWPMTLGPVVVVGARVRGR